MTFIELRADFDEIPEEMSNDIATVVELIEFLRPLERSFRPGQEFGYGGVPTVTLSIARGRDKDGDLWENVSFIVQSRYQKHNSQYFAGAGFSVNLSKMIDDLCELVDEHTGSDEYARVRPDDYEAIQRGINS